MTESILPRLCNSELLRIAATQAMTIQADSRRLGNILDFCLGGAYRPQVIDNALEIIRDMRASLNETYHFIVCTVLDPHLRDHPTIYDSHGTAFTYRGCENLGIRISSVSGESQHTLRVVYVSDEGFIAEKDQGPQERFSYGTIFSRPNQGNI